MKYESTLISIISKVILLILLNTITSCVSTQNQVTQFEQFSLSFLNEKNNTIEIIEIFSNNLNLLKVYGGELGTDSYSQYSNFENIIKDLPGAKRNMEIQIQILKDVGNSVTIDGRYSSTKKKVHGWNITDYNNLHISDTLNVIDQLYEKTVSNYHILDFKLFERPNKPFNIKAINILSKVKINIIAIKSDISAKNWKSGKENIDKSNNLLKDAIVLDLNNIELYQISLLQLSIKNLANEISLGATINDSGIILKNAAEGAANILGGLGSIIKGIGDTIDKDK